MKTRVSFRLLEGGVIALFPDESADCRGNILSYQHIGQHGAASRQLMKRRKASPEQYKPLKQELESIGYDLEVTP